MSVAEISEQLNLTSIKDHGWHIQVQKIGRHTNSVLSSCLLVNTKPYESYAKLGIDLQTMILQKLPNRTVYLPSSSLF